MRDNAPEDRSSSAKLLEPSHYFRKQDFQRISRGISSARHVPGTVRVEALTNLSLDYKRILEDGLLFDDAEPFEMLLNQCRALEARANKPA